jgi:hypothetical protein
MERAHHGRDLVMALGLVAVITGLRLVARELEAVAAGLFFALALVHAVRESRANRGWWLAAPVVVALGATVVAFVAMRAAMP